MSGVTSCSSRLSVARASSYAAEAYRSRAVLSESWAVDGAAAATMHPARRIAFMPPPSGLPGEIRGDAIRACRRDDNCLAAFAEFGVPEDHFVSANRQDQIRNGRLADVFR